ncbi:MAG: FMN-binding protein [Fuerstiella sp.]
MTESDSPLHILSQTNSPDTDESARPSSSPQGPVSHWKNRTAVGIRILLLMLMVVGIRARETADLASQPDRHIVTLQQAQMLNPEAVQVQQDSKAGQEVRGPQNRLLGTAATTIPKANGVIGYRGASHCLLLLNQQNLIVRVALLSSKDTAEHVDLIQQSETFWKQFEGWKQGSPKSLPEVDAVSGATLTSLAIAEGIALRLGQQPGSLKFPDAIRSQEVSAAWPDLPATALISDRSSHVVVHDQRGSKIGTLIRTGRFTDSILGYQGPTELLIQLNSHDEIQSITKRSTWDNEPYCSYLDDEPWFWDPFLNSPLAETAKSSLEELGIEGVSGATMTSMAAAETLITAAQQWNPFQQQQQVVKERDRIHWTANDIGSVAVVLLGCLFAFTRLRSSKKPHRLWNLVLVIYFGLLTGNLVSLVIILGWSASGIAYQLAPGLSVVVIASFLLPALTKRNIYCSHICPHGAAQQLLRNRMPKKFRLPKPLMRWLTWIPGALLILATVTVLLSRTIDLAAIEPFNAYIWYASGTSSIVLAVTSLLWSTFEPMAWCRYGCATGRLLDYVRLSASSAKPSWFDAIILSLTISSLLKI